MDEYETLNHTTWDCKYHVVFIPKYRRKVLYQELRKALGEVFRQLAAQKEAKVEEGHLLPDHVHMLLSIPPKYAVSNVVGTSRVRAPSIWRGSMANESAISRGKASGPAVILSARLGATRKQFGSTSRAKRRKTNGWSSSNYGSDGHLQVAHLRGAALASPLAARWSGQIPNSRVSDDTAALSG